MKMETKTEILTLPEGKFSTKVQIFSKADKPLYNSLYKNWRDLSDKLKEIGGRGVNFPEGISEGAFCIEMGAVRITNPIAKANTSFDCYNLTTKQRIQIKACSVIPDLTSFGPKSVWDVLYFLDFYRDGSFDGKFDIYLIPNNFILENYVNKNQDFITQQGEKRRPRFSIYSDIIQKNNLKPVKTGNLGGN